MSSSGPRFVVDPTRVTISGDRQREVVGLSLRIGDGGIELQVRTGAVSEETIGFDYAAVDEVGVEEELAYALVLRAGETSYKMSNVTANDEEIEAIVSYIRTRMRRARRDPSGRGAVAPDGDQAAAGESRGGNRSGATSSGSGGDGGSSAEELKRWVELHEEGVISEEELEAKKRELL